MFPNLWNMRVWTLSISRQVGTTVSIYQNSVNGYDKGLESYCMVTTVIRNTLFTSKLLWADFSSKHKVSLLASFNPSTVHTYIKNPPTTSLWFNNIFCFSPIFISQEIANKNKLKEDRNTLAQVLVYSSRGQGTGNRTYHGMQETKEGNALARRLSPPSPFISQAPQSVGWYHLPSSAFISLHISN